MSAPLNTKPNLIETFPLQAKNNFDPSVGVIDTSKWLSSGGANGGPGAATQPQLLNQANNPAGFIMQQQQQPQAHMNNPAVSGKVANTDWTLNQTLFGNGTRVNFNYLLHPFQPLLYLLLLLLHLFR